MQRGFTIQSKVDGLVLDGLVVEPEEGVQRTALLQLSHGMSRCLNHWFQPEKEL